MWLLIYVKSVWGYKCVLYFNKYMYVYVGICVDFLENLNLLNLYSIIIFKGYLNINCKKKYLYWIFM